MSTWPVLPLREAIERIVGGKNIEAGSGSSSYRILKVSAVTSGRFRPDASKPAPDEYDPPPAHFIRKHDFLFSRANTKDLVGAVAVVESEYPGLLLPDKLWRIEWRRDVMDQKFAYFLLRTAKVKQVFAQVASGTSDSMKNISQEKLLNIEVPVPPLVEQRRIVSLLSRATEIRRKADAARAKVRAIVPALFFEMFGDPSSNPKGWPVQPLSELAEIGSGLTKGRKLNGASVVPTPYLRVANVQADHLDLSEIKLIDATGDDWKRCRLEVGDLLMTEGGDIDKLGRCAMWRGEIDLCLHQNHVFRVRMGNSVIPNFARAFMQREAARSYFLRVAKRTTGIASINKTQLGQLPVWVPPLPLQTAFVEQAQRLEATTHALDAAATKAESIAAALSAGAFG